MACLYDGGTRSVRDAAIEVHAPPTAMVTVTVMTMATVSEGDGEKETAYGGACGALGR